MLAALVVSLAAPLAAAVVIPPVAYKASLHPSGDCGRCLTAVTVNGVQSAVV
jgi:hypothetical protein